MVIREQKELDWTGERYVPQIRGAIALEHLHRYAFATEYVDGKDVLDIASGEGYGSEMIARTAKHVYGVDIDQVSVEHAQLKYLRKNLQYQVGSCTEIPLADASVDVVVSFETIEHITDHDMMMSEVKRVLRPGGILIISSPEKHGYSIAPQNINPFHLRELNKNEFQELLKKYFQHTSYLAQRVIYGSVLIGEDGKTPAGKTYKFANLPEKIESQKGLADPVYILAVCSDLAMCDVIGSLCEQQIQESQICIDSMREIAKLKELIKEKESSLSWKITQPLRVIGEIMSSAKIFNK